MSVDDKLQLVLTAKNETDAALKAARAQIKALEREMIEVNKELDKPGNAARWEHLRAQMQDAQADMVRLKAESTRLRREMAEATQPAIVANRRLQTSFDALMRKMGTTGGAAARMSAALGRMSTGAAAFRAKWTVAVDKVKAKLTSMRAQLSSSSLVSGFSKMLPGLGMVAAGAVAMGVKTASSMEQTQMSFEQLTGSTEKAADMVQWLKDTATKTPFDLAGLTDSTKKLMAYGFTADEAKDKLMSIGDAAAATGIGTEGIDAMTTALGQMQAKQKISGEEMLQLTEANIPAWQMLADKMGTTVPKLQEMVQTQGGAAELYKSGALDDLFAAMNEQFAGGMERQSDTIAAHASNLMDKVSQSLGDLFGDDMFGPDVKKGLDALGDIFTQALGGLRKILTAIKGPMEAVFGFIGDHAAAFKAAAITVGVLTAALWLTNVALGAMNAVLLLNPITWIVIAIAAFVALLVEAYNHVDWFRAAVDAAWAWIKKAIAVFVNWFKAWVLPAIKMYLHAMGIYFRAIWTVVKFVFRVVAAVIRTTWGVIKGIFGAIGGFIRGPLAGAWRFIATSAKAAWDRVKSVFNTAKGIVTGVIDGIKGALRNIWNGLTDGLSSAVQQVKDTLASLPGVGSLIPGLWTGGPATAGRRYMVGEIGPELFVPRTGTPRMIGVGGPQVMTFPTDGFVVPSFALPDSLPGSAVPTVVTVGGASRGSDGAAAGLPGVHIDRIDAREDPDAIVRRIEAAQRRAMRIAAERSS